MCLRMSFFALSGLFSDFIFVGRRFHPQDTAVATICPRYPFWTGWGTFPFSLDRVEGPDMFRAWVWKCSRRFHAAVRTKISVIWAMDGMPNFERSAEILWWPYCGMFETARIPEFMATCSFWRWVAFNRGRNEMALAYKGPKTHPLNRIFLSQQSKNRPSVRILDAENLIRLQRLSTVLSHFRFACIVTPRNLIVDDGFIVTEP